LLRLSLDHHPLHGSAASTPGAVATTATHVLGDGRRNVQSGACPVRHFSARIDAGLLAGSALPMAIPRSFANMYRRQSRVLLIGQSMPIGLRDTQEGLLSDPGLMAAYRWGILRIS